MLNEVPHVMLNGRIVNAKIRQHSTPLLTFCNFDDGRKAMVIKTGDGMYKYTFDNGEEAMFKEYISRRLQINIGK